MNFQQLDSGSKLILLASIVAFLSLFFNWVDAGIFALNGFQQQGFFFLILFIYPFMQVVRKNPINKVAGLACSVLSIIGIIAFIMSKSVDFFGQTINVASTGMYVFLIASVLLLIGVIKYSNKEEVVSSTPGNPEN